MPQKKNPDVAELTRGKAGRVFGDLVALLTIVKGLPLTYNRDLQEDKERLFDALDTVKLVLAVFAPMLASVKVKADRMLAAASEPGLMATDLTEWLVRQGVPFRAAHERVGKFVRWCQDHERKLNEASVAEMRQTIPEATPACRRLFDPRRSVAARNTLGGTAPKQVAKQLARWRKLLG